MIISDFENLLEVHVPNIGQPVTYGRSPIGKEKQGVSLEVVTYWRDRYPLLVIPTTSEGVCSHIFWMIDDLIFDTSTGHALKRIWPTVAFLLENKEVTIHVRHYKEPMKKVALQQGGIPYSRKMQSNFEHNEDGRIVMYTPASKKKKRCKRKRQLKSDVTCDHADTTRIEGKRNVTQNLES